MKQQCPKCGNWVEGTAHVDLKRKMTDAVTKKGAAWLIGTAVGTFVAPGIGTAVGGGIATALVSDEVDKGAQKVNDLLYGNAGLDFHCPNCGYTWMSSESCGNINREEQEKQAFQEIWGQFFENWDEIFASTETINKFITTYEEITDNMVSPLPKSEMYFMLAFCAYAATDLDRSYLNMARKYNSRAIRTFNDQEYQLFARIISQKEQSQSVESIVSESIKIIADIDENALLIKKDWYMEQLNNAINEVTQRYKREVISQKRTPFLVKSLFCVPILLYIIYKCAIYETTHFWLFSWYPIYWFVIIMLGGAYVLEIMIFWEIIARSDDEWRELALSQYTSFKWSDLFK